MKQKFRAGFTLVELLIVIIIIAVLATIAIPKFNKAWRASSESGLRENLREYRAAIERFQNDTGLYPASLSDIRAQSKPANGLDSSGASKPIPAGTWQGPYMKFYSSSSSIYPAYRNPSYTYTTVAPNVGKMKVNMSWKDLSGVYINTW
ncbi:MAG: prepilin-type N-terminal cleavage/methylation domain-containing protein [Armatimonadota bacterium]